VLISWLIWIYLVRQRPIDYDQDAAHRTSFGEQALSFAVPCLWNTLPADSAPDIKKYDIADTQEETLNKIYIQVIQLLETEGAPEVADSGGSPAHGRWSGGASPPLALCVISP